MSLHQAHLYDTCKNPISQLCTRNSENSVEGFNVHKFGVFTSGKVDVLNTFSFTVALDEFDV